MFNNLTAQFAEAHGGGGISALGLNLKAFIFQLISFVLLLLILRRWVFPKLVATLEKRREMLEKSLADATQTRKALSDAQSQVSAMLRDARLQADSALSDAKKQAESLIKKAEGESDLRAQRIISEAQAQLERQKQQLRDELRGELAALVTLTTEKVIKRKLDEKADRALIENSLKELSR